MNSNSDTFCTDDDMSFDDEEDDLFVSGVIDELEHARIEITGMINVRNDNGTAVDNNNNNNDWDAESYANDSIPLAKLRLCHTPEVEDDWTVQSDCNDSVTLTTKRWSLRAAQRHNCAVALQRIPRRRRASMGEVFVVEQQQQQQQQLSSAVPSTESYRVIVSNSTMEESTTSSSSSGATTTSESSDPVRGVARHKSMPLKAKSTPSTIVPMWRPHKTKTMARRFSNSNGSNCAA